MKIKNILNNKSKLMVLTTAIFSAPVFAAEAAPAGGLGSMLMFPVIFLFMYLFVIRPQNKKNKEHQNTLNSVSKGDEVLLNSGILGKINKESQGYLTIQTGESELVVQKQAIAKILPKGTLKAI